jgi:hypothetical protein
MIDTAAVATVVTVAHLALAAVWLGSMFYSLTVVQPASTGSSPTTCAARSSS